MCKLILFLVLFPALCKAQLKGINNKEKQIEGILTDPSTSELKRTYRMLRKLDLSPKNIVMHDTISLANHNTKFILSHSIETRKHYGAVVIPSNFSSNKLPVMIMATGGDGMHTQFDITQDFNHKAIQFPEFLGSSLDKEFMVVIPSFRGQALIIGDKKFQSEGDVGDAFDGATTDALAFLNVVLKSFRVADKKRIGIYGGSRGGTVALLAASRDSRINRAIVVAAPTDIKNLYLLYPEQFRLLFFNNLLAGKVTAKEARAKFIGSSPMHFIDKLPKVQLHHDLQDPFVPVEFAIGLANKMTAESKEIQQYYYDEGIHGFWSDPDFWNRVQNFAGELLK